MKKKSFLFYAVTACVLAFSVAAFAAWTASTLNAFGAFSASTADWYVISGDNRVPGWTQNGLGLVASQDSGTSVRLWNASGDQFATGSGGKGASVDVLVVRTTNSAPGKMTVGFKGHAGAMVARSTFTGVGLTALNTTTVNSRDVLSLDFTPTFTQPYQVLSGSIRVASRDVTVTGTKGRKDMYVLAVKLENTPTYDVYYAISRDASTAARPFSNDMWVKVGSRLTQSTTMNVGPQQGGNERILVKVVNRGTAAGGVTLTGMAKCWTTYMDIAGPFIRISDDSKGAANVCAPGTASVFIGDANAANPLVVTTQGRQFAINFVPVTNVAAFAQQPWGLGVTLISPITTAFSGLNPVRVATDISVARSTFNNVTGTAALSGDNAYKGFSFAIPIDKTPITGQDTAAAFQFALQAVRTTDIPAAVCTAIDARVTAGDTLTTAFMKNVNVFKKFSDGTKVNLTGLVAATDYEKFFNVTRSGNTYTVRYTAVVVDSATKSATKNDDGVFVINDGDKNNRFEDPMFLAAATTVTPTPTAGPTGTPTPTGPTATPTSGGSSSSGGCSAFGFAPMALLLLAPLALLRKRG